MRVHRDRSRPAAATSRPTRSKTCRKSNLTQQTGPVASLLASLFARPPPTPHSCSRGCPAGYSEREQRSAPIEWYPGAGVVACVCHKVSTGDVDGDAGARAPLGEARQASGWAVMNRAGSRIAAPESTICHPATRPPFFSSPPSSGTRGGQSRPRCDPA